MTELLLKGGADFNAKTGDGKTALALAIKANHTNVVELPKKHGATE